MSLEVRRIPNRTSLRVILLESNDFSRAIWNKKALALKDYKLHSPRGLVQFSVVFEKFARTYLFQIALEIICFPLQSKLLLNL